ncbi:MAG TPA: hypothetical protein VG826_14690 [Pirellulales bacterium]|nr:hypothetical protein [Pirellulales bacterium]
MKIAWLGLLDSDDATASTRAQDHLVRLARHVVLASRHAWSIDVISCGRNPGCRALGAGVERVVLPVAGSPRTFWDRVSWALPAALSAADLVHLHDGFSRSCEVGLLIARQARKPICMTEWGVEGYWLSTELALRELADVVVCHDVAVANSLVSAKRVELATLGIDVRRIGVPAAWPQNHCLDAESLGTAMPTDDEYAAAGNTLYGTYRGLVDRVRRAAA